MKSLTNILNALECKHEIFDINNMRIFPKQIVAYRENSELKRGIVLNVNKIKTTILSELGKPVYKYGNEQIIIDELVKDKEIYTILIKKYEDYINFKKIIDDIRYVPAMYINRSNNDEMGLICLKYHLTKANRSNKEDFAKFLTQCEELKTGQDIEFFVWNKWTEFYPLNKIKHSEIKSIDKKKHGYIIENNSLMNTFLRVGISDDPLNFPNGHHKTEYVHELNNGLILYIPYQFVKNAYTYPADKNNPNLILTSSGSYQYSFLKWTTNTTAFKRQWNDTITKYNLNIKYYKQVK